MCRVSCQLPRNSAETTCTTSPEQSEVMKLEGSGDISLTWQHSITGHYTLPLHDLSISSH